MALNTYTLQSELEKSQAAAASLAEKAAKLAELAALPVTPRATGTLVETVEVPVRTLQRWARVIDDAITHQRESADCGSFFGHGEPNGLIRSRAQNLAADMTRYLNPNPETSDAIEF